MQKANKSIPQSEKESLSHIHLLDYLIIPHQQQKQEEGGDMIVI
jgi:hypothetical protein